MDPESLERLEVAGDFFIGGAVKLDCGLFLIFTYIIKYYLTQTIHLIEKYAYSNPFSYKYPQPHYH